MKKVLLFLMLSTLLPTIVLASYKTRYSYDLVKKNYFTNDVEEYTTSSLLNQIQLNGIPSLYNQSNVTYDFFK